MTNMQPDQLTPTPVKPVALGQSDRQGVLAEAQRIAAHQGISQEQALWNYAQEKNLSSSDVDTYMGFDSGATQNWAIKNGQVPVPSGNYNPSLPAGQAQVVPSPAVTTPAAPAPTAQTVQPSAPTVPAASNYTAAQTVVDPSKTTQGLMESLLKEDSPWRQRAMSLSMEKMNERGLGSSSMAQGAGVAAAIDAALGIAAPDSQIYSNTGVSNTNATNQAGQFNASAQNQLNLLDKSQGFDLAKMDKAAAQTLMQMDKAQANAIATMATQNGYDINKMSQSQVNALAQIGVNATNQQKLAALSIDAQKALNLDNQQFQTFTNKSTQAVSIMRDLQSGLTNIDQNPNFTDPVAKTTMKDNLVKTARGALAVVNSAQNDAELQAVLDAIFGA